MSLNGRREPKPPNASCAIHCSTKHSTQWEAALLEKIVQAPARDDEGRRLAAFALQSARKVRKHLHAIIADGKTAAINAANDIGQKRSWF
jgi:hypothetical protein